MDTSEWYDFNPGDRVMTREGYVGTVTSVEDGPYPGSETYYVSLDADLGGGAYGPSDIVSHSPALDALAHSSHIASLVAEVEEETDEVIARMASDDYPMLSDILVERPPLPAAFSVTAGSWVPAPNGKIEDFVNKFVPERFEFENGHTSSWSWCRYRHKEHCQYPDQIDPAGSAEAGYDVWQIVDRGYCSFATTEAQQACSISYPGKWSGEPDALPQVDLPYSEGGQRPV